MMNPKHGNRKKVMYVQYRLELTLSSPKPASLDVLDKAVPTILAAGE